MSIDNLYAVFSSELFLTRIIEFRFHNVATSQCADYELHRRFDRCYDIYVLCLTREWKKKINFLLFHLGRYSEYDGYDDVYGHSMDEESCMSPTDAQQWIYDRNQGQQSVASFMTNNQNIKEESDEETDAVADELYKKLRRDSDVSIPTKKSVAE